MKKGGNPNKDWKPVCGQSLDKTPVSFKVYAGMREALMLIDKWPDKMRIKTQELIDENTN